MNKPFLCAYTNLLDGILLSTPSSSQLQKKILSLAYTSSTLLLVLHILRSSTGHLTPFPSVQYMHVKLNSHAEIARGITRNYFCNIFLLVRRGISSNLFSTHTHTHNFEASSLPFEVVNQAARTRAAREPYGLCNMCNAHGSVLLCIEIFSIVCIQCCIEMLLKNP